MATDDQLTAEQRLDAVAEILARGVHRCLVQETERESRDAPPNETETTAPVETAR